MTLFAILRHRLAKSIVLVAIVLQVVNISIDPVDHLVGAQDIAINEIESCVEFVVEVLMDQPNAIGETDEPDDSSNRQTSFVAFIALCPTVAEIAVPFTMSENISTAYCVSSFYPPSLSITSPPPKS